MIIKHNKYDDQLTFSYENIINKMKEKNPDNRYNSFAEIKDEIGKYDFINMDISEEDKKIYQDFANSIYSSLNIFIGEKNFNYDTLKFISKIEKALSDNAFEDVIQNNADIISSIVIGSYRYNTNTRITCEIVKSFIRWYKNSNNKSQELILSNIISKLSNIKIEIKDDDLPF